jgi:putative effector of murein hydrolase
VELGDVQGAASSLAIVVTGLLTVIAAPLFAMLA